MENKDISKIDSIIDQLSDRFQKALVNSSEPKILLGIKRELEYWKQLKSTARPGNFRQAS